ncbi:Serpin B11 [Thelohanellus kitauei]|uniref:Serpin B11 n=1 Tax=Thelohanellus kitauei TaxID=669202 RepID=A0A0C2JMA5_THEKT|nr:Serpin B11 [Thelohanellus kitauei]
MSVEGVNRFTASLLNQFSTYQNGTGNVAVCGVSLYIMMGAINFGLDGQSYDQLSRFLGERFEELYGSDTWIDSITTQKWTNLVQLTAQFYRMNSALFCTCAVYGHYQRISKIIFRLNNIYVNLSNHVETAQKINMILYRYTLGSNEYIFVESELDGYGMIFLDALSISAEWTTKFDIRLTRLEKFYDDRGQPLDVAMMNQECLNLVYDSPDQGFRIIFISFEEPNQYAAIVLPRDHHSIIDVLRIFNFDEIKDYMNSSFTKFVKFKMPKFHITSHNDYVQTLKKFGVRDIFDPDLSDFGKMTDQRVFIGKLMQVVNVAVEESGVNAEDDSDESLSDTDEYNESTESSSETELQESMALPSLTEKEIQANIQTSHSETRQNKKYVYGGISLGGRRILRH